MRIRMKIALSGLRNGKPWPAVGQTTELPTGEAQHLVASGIAEEVKGDPPAEETATPPAAETAKAPAAETTTPPAETKRGRGRPRKTSAAEE
ncbi:MULTISPECIES: hypothetical protein [unclassified Streptomyces]|uniref:hypothetical protein n=1 Tax=unclassified Streptomyces TaxID=2593676 RepID=UPI0024A8D33C|nr:MULTISPECIES: hypothetical protein [unclassified Streptomyces]